jgi:hypothetical protein
LQFLNWPKTFLWPNICLASSLNDLKKWSKKCYNQTPKIPFPPTHPPYLSIVCIKEW